MRVRSSLVLVSISLLAACAGSEPSETKPEATTSDVVAPPENTQPAAPVTQIAPIVADSTPIPTPGIVTTPKALGGLSVAANDVADAPSSDVHFPRGLIAPAKASTHSHLHTLPSGLKLNESADLSENAPPPGNQEKTDSCVSWATGYSLMGYYAKESSLDGFPFAPMYLYSQLVKGDCSTGTSLEGNLDLLKLQGIPSAVDYEPMEDKLDCKTQPSSVAKKAARAHRITGYTEVDLSVGNDVAIKTALHAGHPLVIGLFTFSSIDKANHDFFVVKAPRKGEEESGAHAVAVFAYSDDGVWFLNSWGADWGFNGWGLLSWDFVLGSSDAGANVFAAATIDAIVQ